MARQRILISSAWGEATAVLANTDAARALAPMLPLTLEMRDHMRQEKTGTLPSPLPEGERVRAFSAGTLGIWGRDHFVIYYRDGHVPSPGIMIIGDVAGGATLFDRPGPVTVKISATE